MILYNVSFYWQTPNLLRYGVIFDSEDKTYNCERLYSVFQVTLAARIAHMPIYSEGSAAYTV